jgi:hypothetical protein
MQFACLALACVVTASVESVDALPRKFSGFVMKSYCSALELVDVNFMYGCANGNSREARRLHKAKSCPTNYSANFISN